MNNIFKYPIYLDRVNYLYCGEILHFADQCGQLFVWAKTTPPQSRMVTLVGTGPSFDDTGKRHIGTAITMEGSFVVHAFTDVDRPQ